MKIKKFAFAVFSSIIVLCALTGAVCAESADTGRRLFDEAGYFKDTKVEYNGTIYDGAEFLNDLLLEAEKEAGFYVAVLISDDIGENKSDRAVVDYADVYYEEQFGKNTDGILLFINMDNKYDWISTSGYCIQVFSDERIDWVFNVMGNSLDEEQFERTVELFAREVCYYASQGVPDGWYSQDRDNWSDPDDVRRQNETIGIITFLLIADVIIAFIVVKGVKAGYKISPARDAADYLNRSSVKYHQKSDTFIRTYVTSHRIESSSGGGRSGGRSGGSSTHRSSGGGSHGGGGRRR
ncbi:MAG: TPM domain-containing protein [Oscillospiraceae bacterium]|jgi:uncharacterized protein|nr:TPM domain-containing protein [Oscillospiraceae bacterium]